MKRISIGLLLLAMTPGIVEATYYIPARYRVHYSPYALHYGRSGLIPGGLDYSLHTVRYGASGLVYEGALYTLYAVNYGSTGLAMGYCAYPAYYAYPLPYYAPCAVVPCFPPSAIRGAGHVKRDSSYAPRVTQDAQRTTPDVVQQRDGLDTIRQYLRAKGIENASINRICRIDGRLISVDFTLTSQNLIIKYWNPQEIDRLSAKETFKQKAYERHKQNWEGFARQFEQNGGTIYHVKGSDEQTIVAALNSCDKLDTGHRAPGDTILYARQ